MVNWESLRLARFKASASRLPLAARCKSLVGWLVIGICVYIPIHKRTFAQIGGISNSEGRGIVSQAVRRLRRRDKRKFLPNIHIGAANCDVLVSPSNPSVYS